MCRGKSSHSVSIGNGKVATSTIHDDVRAQIFPSIECIASCCRVDTSQEAPFELIHGLK